MVDYGESVNTLHMRESQNAPPAKHFMSQPRIALNYILQAGGSAHLPRQMIFEHVEAHNLFVVESAPVYHREIFAVYLAKSQKTEVIKQVIGLFPQLAV
jgi:hypothetical protein